MVGTFVLFFFAAIVLTVWSLVKPQHFSKYAHGKVPKRKHLGLTFGALAFAFMMVAGATAPPQTSKTPTVNLSTTSSKSQSQTPAKPKNTVTAKQVNETQPIPFTTTTQNNNSLAKGQTKTTQAGKNGVTTLIYKVAYTNGKETGRTLVSQTTTAPMVPEIVENGTYVAPIQPTPVKPMAPPAPTGCTNGTYVNSSGNTVCSPESAPSAPAGATAKCNDGTYSFSQHHSGTCSGHDGVAGWL